VVRPRKEPSRVAAVVDACLDQAAGQRGAAGIWRAWAEAVGPQIARRASPVRLRGGTLIVAVSSAPWMQELQLLKRTVRDALNARLPQPLVEDLFFVLTEGPDAASRARATRVRRCAAPPAAVDLDALPEPLRRSFAGVLAAWQRRATR
jgi:hypothetical protein